MTGESGFRASSNRSGSARQLAGKAGSGDLCRRWDGGREGHSVLENKVLLKCFEECGALKSLLDTPYKYVLFCLTVSVRIACFFCVITISIQPCVLRHHPGHMTSQKGGQVGRGSVKLQLSSRETLELIRSRPGLLVQVLL